MAQSPDTLAAAMPDDVLERADKVLDLAKARKLSLAAAESCTGGPAETINCLVGIAYRKQVAFLASQQAQDLNLSEVCVLELVDQDKASALFRSSASSGGFSRRSW